MGQRSFVLVLWTLLAFGPVSAAAAPRDAEAVSQWLAVRAAERLGTALDRDRVGAALETELAGEESALAAAVRAAYRRSGGRLLFADDGRLIPTAEAVVALLLDVERHGVPPVPYRLAELRERRDRYLTGLASVERPHGGFIPGVEGDLPSKPPFPPALESALVRLDSVVAAYLEALRRLDVRLVAGVLRFVHEARGEVYSGAGMARQLAAIARDPEKALAALLPQHPQYALLTEAMGRYLALWRDHPIDAVPSDLPLVPGDSNAGVAALRARLAWEGFLPEPGPSTFDGTVAAALVAFQRARGLDESGRVDDPTMVELNRPPEWLVRRLVLALARWRESPLAVPPATHVHVNVPEYVARVVVDGVERLRQNALVGKPGTRTPTLRARLRDLTVNPRWTVPPGVARREIAPAVAADPGFLSANGFSARRSGERVAYTQAPGPQNWLGRVFFSLGHPDGIALHGAYRKHLLEQARRGYSSGCVNLADEVAVLRLLLERDRHPALSQLDEWLEGWQTRRVRLKTPVDVFFTYETVVADGQGGVRFLPDVYRTEGPRLSGVTLDGFGGPPPRSRAATAAE